MKKSSVMEKLRAGECAYTTQIGSAYAPFAGMAAQIGFDCIWLDMEHKFCSNSSIRECIMAAALYGTDTVVRIRKRGYVDYFRPLEDGATGIMVPHCMSKEEAEWAVRNTKFYPVGLRGMDFSGLCSDYFMTDGDECIRHAINETFTVLQIEDIEALNQIELIAAVKGIDILFVGPSDLTQSAKHANVYHEDFIEQAFQKVHNAVYQYNDKWWGTVSADAKEAKWLREMGARFISVSGDFFGVKNHLELIMSQMD